MSREHKSVCILLVDDHSDTLEVMARVLRRGGYDVVAVTSADEAVAAARDGRCDLVVSDIGMPGRDGLDLMRELRGRRGLRGIALSGFVRAQDRVAAQAAGFERFLAKPVDLPDLLAAVRDLTAAPPPPAGQPPPLGAGA